MTGAAKWRDGPSLAALLLMIATGLVALIYWVKGVLDLGDRATANSRLSYADREIAGGNSIILDQDAAYRARALVPPSARYRVVVGSNLINGTELTRRFSGDWFRYFLMPIRPGAQARWVVCYGCEPATLGHGYAASWRDDNGISIGRLR
ncbi:MAG TPA: hypothetical protein VE269_03330 [Gaiellaceae bacterium]|nr:hypothetical protein [Gaiellaceae bacterium]